MKNPARDLTAATGLTALSGERVVDIAAKTLDAAARLIATWDTTEPLVALLLTKVRAYAAQPEIQTQEATKLLTDVVNVSRAVAQSATAVLRASDGMTRLAMLLEQPTARRAPGELTEKQLVGVVLETARRIQAEQGACPLGCGTAVDVTPAPARNGTAVPAED